MVENTAAKINEQVVSMQEWNQDGKIPAEMQQKLVHDMKIMNCRSNALVLILGKREPEAPPPLAQLQPQSIASLASQSKVDSKFGDSQHGVDGLSKEPKVSNTVDIANSLPTVEVAAAGAAAAGGALEAEETEEPEGDGSQAGSQEVEEAARQQAQQGDNGGGPRKRQRSKVGPAAKSAVAAAGTGEASPGEGPGEGSDIASTCCAAKPDGKPPSSSSKGSIPVPCGKGVEPAYCGGTHHALALKKFIAGFSPAAGAGASTTRPASAAEARSRLGSAPPCREYRSLMILAEFQPRIDRILMAESTKDIANYVTALTPWKTQSTIA